MYISMYIGCRSESKEQPKKKPKKAKKDEKKEEKVHITISLCTVSLNKQCNIFFHLSFSLLSHNIVCIYIETEEGTRREAAASRGTQLSHHVPQCLLLFNLLSHPPFRVAESAVQDL